MRELSQAYGPIVVLTADAAAAIEGGADDAGATPDEVARRVAARLKTPRVVASEEAPPAESPGPGEKRRRPLVLVVEDDEDARLVLRELLRRATTWKRWATALKRASELNPDLILLDLFLPGMDGFGALTGLPNFRSFHARLEEEVARAYRYGHPLACAMVDLDGLKEINDQLGHAAGNRAITALADAVRGSIGVAGLSAEELDPAEAAEDLLRRADEALYRAKRSGRDRVEVAQVPH